MLTSNSSEQPVTSIAKHGLQIFLVWLLLNVFAIGSIWIMQNSINAYVLQTYHQPSPLVQLERFPAWKKGGEIGHQLYQYHHQLSEYIETLNQSMVQQFNQYTPSSPTTLIDEVLESAILSEDAYVLTHQDKILFAGDSMMQGVAPHVQKYLQQYQIKSINLSKQSTGLSYPSFFNWPKTIEDTLKQDPQIKILAVFLGPNDPWDMPHPVSKKILKFQTPEWEAEYRSRIAHIIQIAQQHQVTVIWITPPNMRKTQLNQQMIYMNQIMHDELNLHQVKYLDSREILNTTNNVYNDYLEKDGQKVKMRTGDGIHFTIQGQKLIADALQQTLIIRPPQEQSQ